MIRDHRNRSLVFSIIFLILLLSTAVFLANAEGTEDPETGLYEQAADRLFAAGMRQQGAYVLLLQLTALGPRLTGSPQAAAAVELTRQMMTDLELTNIHLEPTRVGRWVRGEEETALIISSRWGTRPLKVASIGGSDPTPETGIDGPVIEVKTFEELKAMGAAAKGAIIFFNRPMDPTLPDTFSAYGGAADQRVRGAVEGARAGAVAVLVRSLTTRRDDFPHTGVMLYEEGIPRIPAACLSTMGADELSRLLHSDPELRVHLKLDCRHLSPVISHNVIGEIEGSEKPEEIVLLGGHLDSWDQGTGAHDDGAGCVHALEALHLIKAAGLRPKRTVRAVMFMDEEFGGTGGRDYAGSPRRRRERHIAAIESDRGGFLPLGFGIGHEDTFAEFKHWEPLFQRVGLQWLRPGGGGVDIGPLGQSGTLLIGLIPDSQRYFDVHHSALDTIETVNSRELEMGAVAMALLAYILAQEGVN
ncbi:MAG: M20/M25/M40 family metallo-hydrolase [Candidatus Aminicenantes bacterium]|nr:M20/M25/M40 family metallo-hydrolase [Candidatus Aminicenantes bacterium]